MSTPYPNNVVKPQVGESVLDTAVIGRPLDQLTSRTDSLNERVEAQLLGSALIDWEASVQADVRPGMAVYKDHDGVWKPAWSQVNLDSGQVVTDTSALASGVVQYKHTNTSANIVLAGKAMISGTQLAEITVSGNAETGVLFSASTAADAGKLTATHPPVAVPVAFVSGPDGDDNYTMLVCPGWHDFLHDHIHFHHRLDNDHTTAWELPSVYINRTGLQPPSGAQYRYKIESDATLNAIWPPVPIGAVAYDLDGVAADLVNESPIRIDSEGIWWMDNGSTPNSVRHDFWFTRMTYATDDVLVKSIRALDDSVTVFDLDTGLPAEADLSGRVGIKARFEAAREEVDTGDRALTQVDDDGNFKYAPMVAGVKSAIPSLLAISGGLVHPLDPDARYGGVLELTPSDPDANRSGSVDFVSLTNVQVINVDGLDVYEFKASPLGSIQGRVRIPDVGIGGTFSLALSFSAMPLLAGVMPDMPITYRVLSKSASPASLPTVDIPLGNLTLSSPGNLVAKQYVTIDAPVITGLNPGDLVIFNLSRTTTGGLPGSLALVDQAWTTTPES